jgi:adenine-specific DNA methylase
MRAADVERSFGNKVTWDTPFENHFRNFAQEANRAVFDNRRNNIALNLDALDTPIGADLVYLDPPYLNANGGGVDYRDFYHFLEGLVHYDEWDSMIDYKSRHKRLIPEQSIWNSNKTVYEAFENLVERHQKSILVISYRDDGLPNKAALIGLLKRYKSCVREAQQVQK